MDKVFLPPFTEVVSAFFTLAENGQLQEHVSASLTRALTGFFVAIAIAIPLGIAIAWYRPVSDFLNPILELFRNTAALALLPVFVLILGIGEESKIALVIYACTFPILLNTISGVRTVDPLLIKSAASLGGFSSIRLFQKVVLPAAVPTIFTGIRMAAASSILVLIAAEMVGAKAGLGYLITASQLNFQIPNMYAGIVAISLLGLTINAILVLIERRSRAGASPPDHTFTERFCELMSERQFHLNAFLMGVGHHEAAWRHPRTNAANLLDVKHFQELGENRRAWKAGLGVLRRRSSSRPAGQVQHPGDLRTRHLAVGDRGGHRQGGLIATASTSYSDPYTLARKFASLDHISGGRGGWNIVTSAGADEAANFGLDAVPTHSGRYERAEEFLDVTLGLWDSWEEGGQLSWTKRPESSPILIVSIASTMTVNDSRWLARSIRRGLHRDVRCLYRPVPPRAVRISRRGMPKRVHRSTNTRAGGAGFLHRPQSAADQVRA